MKKTLFTKTAQVLIIICTASISLCKAQAWVGAYSTGYLYHTDPGSVFTWNGGSRYGYCNGYGTIQWYENGVAQGRYVGNVVNGKNEGYGTQYYNDGSIFYEGPWEDDEIKNLDAFNTLSYNLGNLIEEKIFDGGTSLRTNIVQLINNGNDGDVLKIRITFHGDIITSNFYALTLVIDKEAPYVHFEDLNDNANTYMGLKLTIAAADVIYYLNHQNQNQ